VENESALRLANCFFYLVLVGSKPETPAARKGRNKNAIIYHNEDQGYHFPQAELSVGESLPLMTRARHATWQKPAQILDGKVGYLLSCI